MIYPRHEMSQSHVAHPHFHAGAVALKRRAEDVGVAFANAQAAASEGALAVQPRLHQLGDCEAARARVECLGFEEPRGLKGLGSFGIVGFQIMPDGFFTLFAPRKVAAAPVAVEVVGARMRFFASIFFTGVNWGKASEFAGVVSNR